MKDKRYFVESPLTDVLTRLLHNKEIRECRKGEGDFEQSDKIVIYILYTFYYASRYFKKSYFSNFL